MSNKIERNTQVEKLLVKGGLYLFDPEDVYNPNARTNGFDQHYGVCVPVYNNKTGEFHMVDTYKIEVSGAYTDVVKEIESYFNDTDVGEWVIRHAGAEYYYNNSPKVTTDNIHKFHFVGALSDFKEVGSSLWNKYKDEDKFNGFIARERKYPYGSYLVKKDANPDATLELEQAYRPLLKSVSSRAIYKSDYEEYLKLLDECKAENALSETELDKYEKLIKLYKKRIELEKEFAEFKAQL